MTLRPRDRIALGAILLVALVGAYYMLALKPEQHKAATLATAIAGERQTLVKAQSDYATGRAAQASLKTSAPQWAALRRAVPNASDIPALLRVLERNANAVHVKMQAIQLSGSGGSTSAGSTGAGSTPGVTPTTSGATSIPLSLSFSGGYTELNSLVRRLDGLVVVSGSKVNATGPLLSISNVSLSGSPKLTVQLTATIYQLSAATTPAAATTGGQS